MPSSKRQKVSHKNSAVKESRVTERESSPASSAASEPDVEGGITANASEEVTKSFKDLGVVDSLCDACANLGYTKPTPIQAQSIPHALANRDIIGLAETGSGKTAAFALPVIQALLEKPQAFFGLVLAPTRELAAQIGQQFEALGSLISLRTAVIVGGLDIHTEHDSQVAQAIALGKKPHVIVATPGRLVDHLEKTKGFSLRSLKYLVMDEADRLLDMDFGPSIDKILKFIPRERRTFLFSATMSSKIESLQRASLRDPVRVSISSNKYQTVSTLLQYYLFIPHQHKDTYLIYLANEFTGQKLVVFTRTVTETQRLAILLRTLGFGAIPLHGQLNQTARLGALNKFRADVVINHDLAQDSKTHVHRIGRTARAGKSGIALSLVTQYDLEIWLRIEAALGKKLDEYPTQKEEVMVFQNRVEEAQRHARMEMKNLMEAKGKKGSTLKGKRGGAGGGGGKRRHDDMDAEEG
ncbi:ATP-dependent rRNA helicase rrp-3 [Colletotrichum spaethianum]|uniref:ATP-dependent rRNA helicase RRP3 n=1 Tax=Colletotrichum spaethianum TaxID=700344 RepID=A0AA37PDZ0_9PEZI|nr:ATP-dependent rRNA helicase rrp-3 [Colletotrichum spaethianum]GKT50540.1 ATP-dependent rRNA helicase rrp-3 [Colletotrichum spaethianum]